MNFLKPKFTAIVEIADLGDGLVIRENPDNYPKGESNLYKVGYDLKILWIAELPNSTDNYPNPIMDKQGMISCASWDFNCLIDPKTGKILQKKSHK